MYFSPKESCRNCLTVPESAPLPLILNAAHDGSIEFDARHVRRRGLCADTLFHTGRLHVRRDGLSAARDHPTDAKVARLAPRVLVQRARRAVPQRHLATRGGPLLPTASAMDGVLRQVIVQLGIDWDMDTFVTNIDDNSFTFSIYFKW